MGFVVKYRSGRLDEVGSVSSLDQGSRSSTFLTLIFQLGWRISSQTLSIYNPWYGIVLFWYYKS